MARCVIAELAYQHVEDASFLWLQRDRAVHAPHYSLADLARLDGRLNAQLDALRLDSELSWRFCMRALARNKPGEVFIAAVLACEERSDKRLDAVRKVAEAGPPLTRAVIAGLGWLSADSAIERTKPWLTSESPVWRRVAVAVAAIHRRDPGPEFQKLLEDPDPGVKARALRAAGELGFGSVLTTLRKNLKHADPSCRFWACWSAARLGDKPAVAELQMIAQAETYRRGTAVNLSVRLMDSAATLRWLEMIGQLPGGARLALKGYGWLGDPAAVPRLLDAMKTPGLARVAGEAFTFITGVDLDAEKLAGTKPEGFEAGPNDDPTDENVAMDPDDNLAWPDPDKLRAWWAKNHGRFSARTRYLLGKPMALDWLREVLRIGKQRQRAAAALELAVREPGKPLFEVRAPGFRQ